MGTRAEPADAGTRERPRGGLDAFEAVVVRWDVRGGETGAVRELLAEWAREHREGSVRELLPVEGVNLCTVFLDERGPGPDGLVWYVEVFDDRTPPWTDPAQAVRASPLFDAGLGELLSGEPTVRADGVGGHRRFIVATHPDRQAWYEQRGGRGLLAPVAGDELPVKVAMVEVGLRAGAVSRLAAGLLAGVNWLKRATSLPERYRDDTEILAEERMYSESLLLGPSASGDRQVLYYYMETEEMDQLYEAFEASDDWKARLGGWLLRTLLERPEVMLEPPLESDYEVLVHAVDPERS
jgi:hypothetical protein